MNKNSSPIHVISQDVKFYERISAAIKGTHPPIMVFRDPTSIGDDVIKNDKNIILFDTACAISNQLDFLKKLSSHKRNIVALGGDSKQTIDLLSQFEGLSHIFSKPGFLDDKLLLATLSGLTSRQDCDLKQYLSDTAKLKHETIKTYMQRDELLSAVQKHASQLKAFPELPQVVASITWELIMNAIFDAPTDGKNPKYAHLPRTSDFELEPNEFVKLSYGYDQNIYLISVTDNFGGLDRTTLVSNLKRCSEQGVDQIKTDTAGAGVGLYMLFSSANQLDFHVTPGKKTQVVAAIHLTKRRKEYQLQGTSVNFFIKG